MPPHDAFARMLIIGNSGSGKSWLTAQASVALDIPSTDLDEIHWLPGGYGASRDKSESVAMVRDLATGDRWIIEGVYGWLAKVALPRTTTLIWLDLPEAECIANLRNRGPRRGQDEAAHEGLIRWASEYRLCPNANQFSGHLELYSAFDGPKHRLDSRGQIDALAKEFRQGGPSA